MTRRALAETETLAVALRARRATGATFRDLATEFRIDAATAAKLVGQKPALTPPDAPATQLRRRDWRDAACTQADDPDVFFRDRGEVKAAVEWCRSCPVRGACLDYALEDPDLEGVWGGETAPSRKRMRRARALASTGRAA